MTTIVWKNVFLLSAMQIAALYGIYLKCFAVNIYSRIFFLVYCHIGAWGVTAGRHRYFSHRSYKGNRVVDILMMLMACTAFEQSIYTWARDHRLHHKHSDTDADPYNSKRGFFFCHMGWVLTKKHPEVKEKGKAIDMSDLQSNPVVMFEYKHNILLAVIFTVLIPLLIPIYCWNEQFLVALCYNTFYRYALILHMTWCVNSFAHLHGMRKYDKTIQPVENHFVSTISLGEGFHNYHHTFPWDYKAGELSADFKNLTTYLIDALAALGWVTERNTVSQDVIEARKQRTGDSSWKAITNNKKSFLMHCLYLLIIA